MANQSSVLPFTGVVGQESMKLALLLNAVSPSIGGVLIRGQRGTAKSTAVRALAQLLPDLEIVDGCRFSCDPNDPPHWCWECRDRHSSGEQLIAVKRPMRVVELPLNASEDRLVGSIDMEAAINEGEKRFHAGILGEANRQILYIDEINLLDDHLVDVLLDAAAMGENVVEREGVSVSHPARFILVATMNPEEGELRPQLLDRFALCVDVSGLRSTGERVLVMEHDARRSAPQLQEGGRESAEAAAIRSSISRARTLLPAVTLSPGVRRLISLLCIDAAVLGHRADIVVTRTARVLRAWRAAQTAPREADDEEPVLAVKVDDIITSAELALAHRRRDARQAGAGDLADSLDRQRERIEELAGEVDATESVTASELRDVAEGWSNEYADKVGGGERAATTEGRGQAAGQPESGAVLPFAGSLFSVRDIQLPRERTRRRMSGKRSSTPSVDKRGRYVSSRQSDHTTDLAFDATLRAAAPHQRARRTRSVEPRSGMALQLERQDLRQKVRRRRTGALIVFLVDASASMDAEQRMQATKGAILSLLRDAYLRRDRVALVVFSGRMARVVLQPTASIDLAQARLQKLSVGGTTPLTHGLVTALKLIRSERLRDPGVYPLLVLISDGRGNISLFGEEPVVEAQRVAAQLAAEKVHVLVIDSARDHTQAIQLPPVSTTRPSTPSRSSNAWRGGLTFNACADLAERSGGEYLGLYDLSQGAILEGVQRTLGARN
ncbi:MAG TPA: VWA domain-containing protein [Candidatus Sulfotelmatobacter sp.]|nr:VWA domain-containing protein [Candidatus Sulfotelmatobacter sp.]